MAIKSLAQVQSATDLVRQKIKNMLARDKYDATDGQEGNILVKSVSHHTMAKALEAELGISLVARNEQSYSSKVGDCTLIVAAQGRGTVLMLKSY